MSNAARALACVRHLSMVGNLRRSIPPCRRARAFASTARSSAAAGATASPPFSPGSLFREYLELSRRNIGQGFLERTHCALAVEIIRSRTHDPAFTVRDLEEGAAQVVQHTSALLQARKYHDVADLCVRGPGRDARGIATDLGKFGFSPDGGSGAGPGPGNLTCDVAGPGNLEAMFFLLGAGCEQKEVRPYGLGESISHYNDRWKKLLEESRERIGGLAPPVEWLMAAGPGLLMSENVSVLAVVNVPCEVELVVSQNHRDIGREIMREDLAAFFERRAAESQIWEGARAVMMDEIWLDVDAFISHIQPNTLDQNHSRAARVLLEGTIRDSDLTWRILNFDLGVCRFNSLGPGLDELSTVLGLSDYTNPNPTLPKCTFGNHSDF